MTDEELYRAGITRDGRGHCTWHGYIASLDSEGHLWCPYCGWIGKVSYGYNPRTGAVEDLDYDDD